jgi:protein arginine kinase activator
MTCDVCKTNDASVFLTQIVEGKMQKVNLCDNCAKAKGVDDPTGFALADLLLGLGAAQEIERGSGSAQRCAVCGFSQADFKKTGRLGCAQCYETFAEGLNSLLKAMHKGTHHTGKVPARIVRHIERENALKVLQRDLQKAVADENYESAAQIRDQLRQLETSTDVLP